MNLGFWEILIITVILLSLFGAKKLPEIAKSIGKGIKAFKEETANDKKSLDADEKKSLDKD